MSHDLRHVIEAPLEQSIVVRAGPGAGKTWLISERIAYLINEGLPRNSQIACITYTNTGIEEVENELVPRHFSSRPRELFLGTIHSFLISYVLKPYGHFLGKLPRDFTLTPPDGYAERFCPGYMKKNIARYRRRSFESVGYELDGTLTCYRGAKRWEPSIKQMRAFKTQMHGAGYIDLNDVLYFAWRLLKEFPFVAECLSCRFVSILVDEFQDTTVLQDAILQKLQESADTSLFLVGDPDQSIFSFAGATPSTFQARLRCSRFRCADCGQTEHIIRGNRRSSRKILRLLNSLSSMPVDQISLADWADYDEPVQVLVAGRADLSNLERLAFYRKALEYFFNLLQANGLDVDEDESFCVLAYENRCIATIRSVHDQDDPRPTSGLDDLKKANLSLYRTIYDLLVAVKHKQHGEWGLAYEATDRALTRLVYRESNPTFCSYDDQDVDLDRELWSVVVWIVTERLALDETQTLLDWCKANKDLIDEAVKQVGGQSIRQSRLGKLDCRGKSRDIAAACRTEEELRSVIRPSLIGDNFRTIHKAKGIQRESVLVFAKDPDEVESWLFASEMAEDESSRRGYVAFSRARKILCIACDTLSNKQESELQDRGVKTVPLLEQQLNLL